LKYLKHLIIVNGGSICSVEWMIQSVAFRACLVVSHTCKRCGTYITVVFLFFIFLPSFVWLATG
jgi:hypothetical protein